MAETSQLYLFAEPPQDAEVKAMVRLLRDSGRWMRAADIGRMMGIGCDRRIRALAAAAAPEVISGQKGYRWVGAATADEITHFVRWMENQAKEMIRRAEAVRRRAHGIVGAA